MENRPTTPNGLRDAVLNLEKSIVCATVSAHIKDTGPEETSLPEGSPIRATLRGSDKNLDDMLRWHGLDKSYIACEGTKKIAKKLREITKGAEIKNKRAPIC